ncbi:hypothetical protein BT63DRAFT_420904 [Microthyrium microscopicum]|uniref:Uncharacterized protein n=1 Tax=Microthyrium microscopicum TaxID=703497 RepID=A0A6A6UME9_9PEZI|nr:hypothetical protein BT63DRAFT_420904 [Microthyrium microscopicum]
METPVGSPPVSPTGTNSTSYGSDKEYESPPSTFQSPEQNNESNSSDGFKPLPNSRKQALSFGLGIHRLPNIDTSATASIAQHTVSPISPRGSRETPITSLMNDLRYSQSGEQGLEDPFGSTANPSNVGARNMELQERQMDETLQPNSLRREGRDANATPPNVPSIPDDGSSVPTLSGTGQARLPQTSSLDESIQLVNYPTPPPLHHDSTTRNPARDTNRSSTSPNGSPASKRQAPVLSIAHSNAHFNYIGQQLDNSISDIDKIDSADSSLSPTCEEARSRLVDIKHLVRDHLCSALDEKINQCNQLRFAVERSSQAHQKLETKFRSKTQDWDREEKALNQRLKDQEDNRKRNKEAFDAINLKWIEKGEDWGRKIQELELKVQDLQKTERGWQKKEQDWQENESTLQKQSNDLQTQLDELMDEVSELQNEREEELNCSQSSEAMPIANDVDITKRIRNLEDEHVTTSENLRLELISLQRENQGLLEQLEYAEEQRAEAERRVEELQDEVKEKAQRLLRDEHLIQQLKENETGYLVEMRELSKDSEKYARIHAAKEERLKEEARRAVANEEETSRQKDSIQKDLEAELQAKDDHEDEVQILQNRIYLYETSEKEAKEEVEGLHSLIRNCERTIDRLEEQIYIREEEIAKLKSTEESGLNTSSMSLEDELAAMKEDDDPQDDDEIEPLDEPKPEHDRAQPETKYGPKQAKTPDEEIPQPPDAIRNDSPPRIEAELIPLPDSELMETNWLAPSHVSLQAGSHSRSSGHPGQGFKLPEVKSGYLPSPSTTPSVTPSPSPPSSPPDYKPQRVVPGYHNQSASRPQDSSQSTLPKDHENARHEERLSILYKQRPSTAPSRIVHFQPPAHHHSSDSSSSARASANSSFGNSRPDSSASSSQGNSGGAKSRFTPSPVDKGIQAHGSKQETEETSATRPESRSSDHHERHLSSSPDLEVIQETKALDLHTADADHSNNRSFQPESTTSPQLKDQEQFTTVIGAPQHTLNSSLDLQGSSDDDILRVDSNDRSSSSEPGQLQEHRANSPACNPTHSTEGAAGNKSSYSPFVVSVDDLMGSPSSDGSSSSEPGQLQGHRAKSLSSKSASPTEEAASNGDIGTEDAGNGVHDAEATGNEALDAAPAGNEDPGAEATNNEARGAEAAGDEASGAQTPSVKAPSSEAPSSEVSSVDESIISSEPGETIVEVDRKGHTRLRKPHGKTTGLNGPNHGAVAIVYVNSPDQEPCNHSTSKTQEEILLTSILATLLQGQRCGKRVLGLLFLRILPWLFVLCCFTRWLTSPGHGAFGYGGPVNDNGITRSMASIKSWTRDQMGIELDIPT